MNFYTYLGYLLMSPMAYICLKYIVEQLIEMYKNKEERKYFWIYMAWLLFVFGGLITIIYP